MISMKKFPVFIIMFLVTVLFAFFYAAKVNRRPDPRTDGGESYCFTGAFIADRPSREDIREFEEKYGKKPYFVMTFIDWRRFPDTGSIEAVMAEGCVPMITWEPWEAVTGTGAGFDKILRGEYDGYIKEFAGLLRSFGGTIFLRFAHEMNGDWYPWSGSIIGAEKYKALYRHVKDTAERAGLDNVEWVFSFNWEDVPATEENHFANYYPGDGYVDHIGIDGYNWGDTRPWGGWMSFRDIFDRPYRESRDLFDKPVLITEFASASAGGDKGEWIRGAMEDIKSRYDIRGFVLFNVDKEVDWYFSPREDAGKELRARLKDPYFISGGNGL